ncbi:MAG TPA: DUF1553 domain-containing protein [Urbifossiella sp.]|nr:DUF1553 domain-containing protein [Urbifossiella sp.]
MSIRNYLGALAITWLASGAVVGAEIAPSPHAKADAAAIAALIDRHLDADWKARGIKPAAPADDAEFARRVYLDVIGRVPKVAELRDFLASGDPHKREQLVDKLLSMPSHAVHFAATTREAWLPQATSDQQFAFSGMQVENVLRTHFRDNTPADVVVRRLLTRAIPSNPVNRGRFFQTDPNDPESQWVGFYQANEWKPDSIGAAASRLFVGIKLECAQCHDHPFAPYTKEQFWEFAAFFAELNLLPSRRPSEAKLTAPQADKNRLTIPNTDKQVVAKFIDGTDPQWSKERSPREELANWLTRPENPYFARNLANRMWAHFFGLGILDPVDEPGENNLPSHPRLLDDLGRAFAAAKFDNRTLIRGITRSKAYGLTSRLSHPTQAHPRSFARMNLKGLTPAQLFDSLVAATGYREDPNFKNNRLAFFPQPGIPRSMYLARFASTDKPTETSTTILQALMLMNGDFIDGQTSIDRSEILGAVVDVPGWNTKRRVATVFLTALAREPSDEELQKYASYVDRGGAANDKKKALGDVFWALLNSPEFLFNH